MAERAAPRGRRPIGTPEERDERRRRLGRERQDRLKHRESKGSIVLPLEVDHVTVGWMLEAGAVDEAGSRNRKRLGRIALHILNNALVTAVASGRKFSIEQEEHHARKDTKGDRNGLHRDVEDSTKALGDRGR